MLNSLSVMYYQHREKWRGRVALDGLGHLLWAGRGTHSQPCLLNLACSIEAQVISQLKSVGTSAWGQLNLWEKHGFCFQQYQTQNSAGQTKPRHKCSPSRSGVCTDPWQHWGNAFQEVAMESSGWECTTLDGTHMLWENCSIPFPAMKSLDFFPSFKNHV